MLYGEQLCGLRVKKLNHIRHIRKYKIESCRFFLAHLAIKKFNRKDRKENAKKFVGLKISDFISENLRRYVVFIFNRKSTLIYANKKILNAIGAKGAILKNIDLFS